MRKWRSFLLVAGFLIGTVLAPTSSYTDECLYEVSWYYESHEIWYFCGALYDHCSRSYISFCHPL
jgi:hypothetical protein